MLLKSSPQCHQVAGRQRLQIVASHHGQAARRSASATIASAPLAVAAAVATAVMVWAPMAVAADIQETFTNKCAGCHMNGGNVLQAGATLFPEDLAKNGVTEPDALYTLIYSGKNKMPGFGQECAPKGKCTFGPRLSDDEIRELTGYVQERAAAGWK